MMTGAISGKTGYTGNAGYCYVGALESDGRTFVVALLACGWPSNKTYKWSDTKALMSYGIENYSYRSFDEIEIPNIATEHLLVTKAVTEELDGEAYVNTKLADKVGVDGILVREDEEIYVLVHRLNTVNAPVKEGTIIGCVSYYVKNSEWLKQNIIITENVEAIGFKWCFAKIFDRWLIKK
jgi:D-alanyl-D-alanine carboxypeptidase (penicillin-binding protein 5/6)